MIDHGNAQQDEKRRLPPDQNCSVRCPDKIFLFSQSRQSRVSHKPFMTKISTPTAVCEDIKPLDGTVILEVGNAQAPVCLRLATSFAGKIASELGAKVVKLEPFDGDPVRHLPPFLPGAS